MLQSVAGPAVFKASGSFPWSMFRFLWFYPHAVCCFRVTRLAPLAGSRLKSLPSLDSTESGICFWFQFFMKARWPWWCWWPSEAVLVSFTLVQGLELRRKHIPVSSRARRLLTCFEWCEVECSASCWTVRRESMYFGVNEVVLVLPEGKSRNFKKGQTLCGWFVFVLWLVCSCRCVFCSAGRICGLTNGVRETKSRGIRGDSSEGQWWDGIVAD